MSINLTPCPKIEVLRWDSGQVYIRCPYCEEIHRHGVELPGNRRSHCRPGGYYEFTFPIDERSQLVGYEINKTNACFVNIGSENSEVSDMLNSPEEDELDLNHLFFSQINISGPVQQQAPTLNLTEDAEEVEVVHIWNDETFEQKRILSAISSCVTGDVEDVHEYLNTSAEANLFLHGIDENGDTTLVMAACEKCHGMVSLLLQHGADPNVVNNKGRSALMQAALWGRIETVEILLKASVDKTPKDSEGNKAIDLAKPTKKNERERYECSPMAAAEKITERDTDRRHIVVLLSDDNAEKQHEYTSPFSEYERRKYEFRKSEQEKTITLHGPVRSHAVSNIGKTAAVLDRGNPFAQVSATSGWTADALPPKERHKPDWIEEVYYIAKIVGHALPNASKDQGQPGRYYACHAEKKLIAYLVDRHVFLPRDSLPNRALEGSIWQTREFLEGEKHTSVTWAKVCDLEEKRESLRHQLWDEDDRALGEDYNEEKVNELKIKMDEVEKELATLESDAKVTSMRAQEGRLNLLLEKEQQHKNLMKLSKRQPEISLKRALILSSNEVCEDCEMFKDKVNSKFGLAIELHWCI